MPWLLQSPGHQQPWHWLYKINWALSSKKKGHQYLRHLSVDKWEKMQLYIFVFQKNIQPTKFNDSTVESEKFMNQRNLYVLSQWRHKFTYTEDIPPNWWLTLSQWPSSNRNIFCVTGPLYREFPSHWWIPPHKGQWRRALMFSLICAWTNSWVKNRDAGDFRRLCAHYDLTVMFPWEQHNTSFTLKSHTVVKRYGLDSRVLFSKCTIM